MNVKTKNILSHLGKIPIFLANNFVFSFLMVIFCIILIANLLFYKYYIVNQEITLETNQGQVAISDKSYNSLLKIWEEQDKKFQDSASKNYIDILQAR